MAEEGTEEYLFGDNPGKVIIEVKTIERTLTMPNGLIDFVRRRDLSIVEEAEWGE